MIEQRPMAAGSCQITLRPDVTQEVIDKIDPAVAGFSLLVVTPGYFDPTALTPIRLLGIARYVGVYRTLADDGLSLSGAGLAILLGDEDDKGPLSTVARVGTVDRTFQEWIDLWEANSTGAWNGLTLGAVENIAGDHRVTMPNGVTPRVWLDQICLQANAEWRVNNDLTIDAGTITNLYPTFTDPTVIVTRDSEGREVGLRGLRAVIGGQSDVEDVATMVEVHYAKDTETASAELDPNPWVRPDGEPLVMGRVHVSENTANEARAQNMADNQLGRTEDVRRQVDISVDVYDIGADVQPGDTVWLFDPRLGYVAEPAVDDRVSYRGELVFPTRKRVHGMSWPVRHGMGVYLVIGGTETGEIVDLSDWVAWEDAAATLEVGSAKRNLLTFERRGIAA